MPRRCRVHLSTCSWNAAQDIQHVERQVRPDAADASDATDGCNQEDRRDAAHFQKLDYPELILEHLRRVTAREVFFIYYKNCYLIARRSSKRQSCL